MSEPEVIEAQGAELVESANVAPSTLWRTDNPATVLERATETANALAPVLRERGMLSRIGDKDHVQIEGWQTLGSMLGVTAVGVWTRKMDNGWEAKVDARTLDGRTIGSAEAMCLSTEDNWKDSDEFAIRSMAQTRAASKALASVLRFVVTLAGFSGTPAEEMGSHRSGGSRSDTDSATEKQREWVLGNDAKGKVGLLEKANFDNEQLLLVSNWGTNDQDKLTRKAASFLIEHLKDGSAEGRAVVLAEVGWSDVPANEEGL
jgi:hypothetical protein